MKGIIKSEIIISAILILLLFVFINPMDLLMPPPFLTMLVVLFVAIFALFVVAVWKEKPRDEREGFLAMYAARIAYIVGAVVLAIGIILQSFSHDLDPWLVYGLSAMIFGKTVGLLYSQSRY